ncbi:MAG: hypothetical protein IPP90_01090 [Gemmatimonadaceae bacterium]|nr:hypothetical protein [Gemmatimonadaceae bacterium]
MSRWRSRLQFSTATCLFLSVWVVYAAHLTSNVVRETYLALAFAERFTVKVDPYLGLHPDLFEIPGRGSYINSNPGASLLGAAPLLLSRPGVSVLFAAKPSLGAPKPPTTYNDPRPNRTLFMNEMRKRGLDVRLAIAALLTQIGLMAPLGALAAVVVFGYLRGHAQDERTALWLSLLYALGTPLFFRSGFLNQNALLAHCVLFSWVLLTRVGAGPTARTRDRDWFISGMLLGFGMVLDYSAAPLALTFGLWSIVDGWQAGGARRSVQRAGLCLLGALPMIGLLLAYQNAAFGSPWFPAQRYMPATEFSVRGWNGMTMPTVSLLWRNLLDMRYGLLAFCPLLVLSLGAPFRGQPLVSRSAMVAAASAIVSLWLFNSANQFASLQWNTGVRYMVPAVPLLFVLAAPVLLSSAVPWRWIIVAPTLLISWAVSMMRENVVLSLQLLVTDGPP